MSAKFSLFGHSYDESEFQPIEPGSSVKFIQTPENDHLFIVSDEAAQERKDKYIEIKGWNDGSAEVSHPDWIEIYYWFRANSNFGCSFFLVAYDRTGQLSTIGCIYQYNHNKDTVFLS